MSLRLKRTTSTLDVLANAEVLLYNFDLIGKLADRATDLTEFTTLLYRFYTVHGKSSELVKWAVENELETIRDANEVCRGETILTKLLNLMFFGDLGKKYLSALMSPFIKDMIQTIVQETTGTSSLPSTPQPSDNSVQSIIDDSVSVVSTNTSSSDENSSSPQPPITHLTNALNSQHNSSHSAPQSRTTSQTLLSSSASPMRRPGSERSNGYASVSKATGASFAQRDSKDGALVGPSTTFGSMGIEWVLSRFEQFIDSLLETTDLCPLMLREALFYLLEAIENKFQEGFKVVGCIIFLRFFCPAVVSPTRYGIVAKDEVPSPQAWQRQLVAVSRLLQLLANGNMLEDNKPDKDAINRFIMIHHKRILEFVSVLLNERVIKHGIKVLHSSVEYNHSVAERSQAAENFKTYIQNLSLAGKNSFVEQTYKIEFEKLMENYQSHEGWKLIKKAKKGHLYMWRKKVDDQPLLIFKIEGKFRAEFNTMCDIIRNYPNLAKFIVNLAHKDCVEKYDEDSSDWYTQTKPNFPFAPRDWLFTHRVFNDPKEKQCVVVHYSIAREDRPVSDKFVRGEIQASGYIVEQDPEDPRNILFTHVSQTNPKGSIPSWIINQATADLWKSAKQIKKFVSPM
mmetsp:Transcript_2856/g.3786  ORF Transcript_2856/g.3786 Transcript_2856/m.3786 type:complete len:625 (-) Transcript_2856:25-1899(-)